MKEYNRTYAEIDLEAIRYNIRQVRKNIRPETKIMAIVKANAYGHGAVPVAKALYGLVDGYGVATMEEALELRKAGLDGMILILGYTGEEWFSALVKNEISQTIYSVEIAEKLNAVSGEQKKKARVHIKIDTGMSRLGFPAGRDSIEKIKRIAAMPYLEIEGAFTHFARADEKTPEAAKEPLQTYLDFIKELEKEGISIPVHHVSNSAAIIHFPEANLDMVRSGIMTYGLYPSEEIPKDSICLKPAMQWKAHISFVKTVEPGTPISYGGTYTAGKKMRIATIPVGYADGMRRELSNRGRVLVHGQYADIVGRVCMDQFMIDVTDIPDVKEGDVVTIVGRDGKKEISVEEIAALSHSFNYEFVCCVTNRVPRFYKN
ncbi:MAG: alanine racemase [Lachnospiraceae bacterium]|nr:alanine racemase [Lachnospiraceae bacterium]